MLGQVLKSNISKVVVQRNAFLLFGVGMLISNFVLVLCVLYKTEKIILVPPQINKTFWLRGGEVSESYIEEMSVFLVDLLLDQTPANSSYKREMLLKYVDSSRFNEMQNKLMEQENYINENDISTDFNSVTITVDAEKKISKIDGDLITYVADKKISSERVSYLLGFEMVGGKLFLSNFEKERAGE